MTHQNSETQKTISEKVAGTISNNKILLWSILALLIISLVVLTVVDSKIKERNTMYSDMIVEIQEDYQSWFNAVDDEKETAGMELLEKLASIVETEKINILVEKALFLRGQYFMQNEEWDNAYADFNRIAMDSPDSYLASVSLYNGASAKENGGDLQSALEILKKISTDFRNRSPIVPEALFNVGRLNEALDMSGEALVAYEDLVITYSSSNWTNLAKTRIISLKASGVSQ